MNNEPELPGSARLFESSGQVGTVVNPFESIPFPNAIRVGLKKDDYPREEGCNYIEITQHGTAELYDDPLGHPTVVFNPEDLALFEFLAAHFAHYAESWKGLTEKERREYMHSFDDPTEPAIRRSEQMKAMQPAWWWAGMHSDAMHPGDRTNCEHCRQMIVAFGKMPPKEEIIKAYEENHNVEGPAPIIRNCVLTPPGKAESERQKYDDSGAPVEEKKPPMTKEKKPQPNLSSDWLNR